MDVSSEKFGLRKQRVTEKRWIRMTTCSWLRAGKVSKVAENGICTLKKDEKFLKKLFKNLLTCGAGLCIIRLLSVQG